MVDRIDDEDRHAERTGGGRLQHGTRVLGRNPELGRASIAADGNCDDDGDSEAEALRWGLQS